MILAYCLIAASLIGLGAVAGYWTACWRIGHRQLAQRLWERKNREWQESAKRIHMKGTK